MKKWTTTAEQYTPGPWEKKETRQAGRGYLIQQVSGAQLTVCYVADASIHATLKLANKDANATLIATAPELLEQLRLAELIIAKVDAHAPDLVGIRYAIAKAEGRTK